MKNILRLFDYDSDYTIGTLFRSIFRSRKEDPDDEALATGRSIGPSSRTFGDKLTMHLCTILGVVLKNIMSLGSESFTPARFFWPSFTALIIGTLVYKKIYHSARNGQDRYSRNLYCVYNGYFFQSMIKDVITLSQ